MKITLCGSARFEEEFKRLNRDLTLAGHTVYSLSVYPSDAARWSEQQPGQSSTARGGTLGKDWYTPEQKERLDFAHLGKIANSDAIFIIDCDQDRPEPYIGESTTKEWRFAQCIGKKVFLSSENSRSADPTWTILGWQYVEAKHWPHPGHGNSRRSSAQATAENPTP